jgi:VCBS repeat-containing protein
MSKLLPATLVWLVLLTASAAAHAVPGVLVVAPTAPSTTIAGQPITTVVVLKNQNPHHASDHGTLRLYLAADADPTRGKLVAQRSVGRIPGGKSRTVTITVATPALVPTDYRVLAAFDTTRTHCTAKKPCTRGSTKRANHHTLLKTSAAASTAPAAPGVPTTIVDPSSVPNVLTLSDGTLTVPENTTVEVNRVITADTRPSGYPLEWTVVTSPVHGTLYAPFLHNYATYTPAKNYSGPDTFSFTASDVGVTSNVETFTVNVVPGSDVPVAVDDAYSTAHGVTLSKAAADGVLANDTQAQHDAITAEANTNPEHGALTLNADGSFSYVPDSGFKGTDTFSYLAHDGDITPGVGTVTITVT